PILSTPEAQLAINNLSVLFIILMMVTCVVDKIMNAKSKHNLPGYKSKRFDLRSNRLIVNFRPMEKNHKAA
ncbi:18202_t:CDS:2, partial [Entrophospora sp. SA101]